MALRRIRDESEAETEAAEAPDETEGEALLMPDHVPLPVQGYTSQSDTKINEVNTNKQLEEQVLRRLDEMKLLNVDQRWLAIGRTHIEEAFMAINRSVFQPTRVKLPGE